MTNNPIELLISLAVNSGKSKENIDDNIKALQKHYEKSPLLLNVDFDKAKAMSNLQNFVKEMSKETIHLNVDVSNGDINKVKSQAKDLKNEFEELNQIASRSKSASSASFNLDLDRVLIQLENLSRKGAIATTEITKFQARVEALRNTNDRLSLKGIVVDIFDLSSEAKHADKVMESLNNALNKVSQSQQKLTNIKDKFNVDPNASDEYIRLSRHIDEATEDIIRLQSIAATGGADDIQLNRQLREAQTRIDEARRELAEFGRVAKSEMDIQKIVNQAKTLYNELARAGNIKMDSLNNYMTEIESIGNSSLSAQAKVTQLTNAMSRLRAEEERASSDASFEAQLDRQITALNKLESKIIRIGTIHRGTVDRMSYNRLIDEVRALESQLNNVGDPRGLRDLQAGYRGLSAEVDRLGANAVTTARASRGLGNALKEAFQKFPIWVGMAALVYTPIRGIQDLTEKVIELDSALIGLQRVMEAPSYEFDTMIQSMLANVEELSGKTSDYLKLTTEFARTGLDAGASQEMANVATILQNISELTADESVNSLTAAMTAFGEETEGALRIADRLNEIDNNFAITTRDLALSMNKAASTAKTFNVSLDEMLGYTTAIGVATRESGNIVGNSLKTIFSRITTNSMATGALNDIGISITDSAGEIRDVSDIIGELAARWDTLSRAEQQNTAVRVAGTNQLSRFNALMLNYDMAVQATETSINSQNSAMSEQNKYAESLEARINRLQTAWYGFANAAGESTLYDGIVVLTSVLKAVTDGGSGLVGFIGMLAPIMGVAGAAVVAFSSNLRGLVISMATTASGAFATSTATTVMGRAMDAGAAAATRLRGAMAGVAASLGIGAVFFALGFAIEKVTSAISENIQAQEKWDQYNKTNVDALTTNKERTEELITTYNNLSEARKSETWDASKEQHYLDVQNQLAEIFPALVDHIDSAGQAHLKNASAIREEIAETEKLSKKQAKAELAGADEMFKDKLKNLNGAFYESFSNLINHNLEDQIKLASMTIEAMTAKGLDTSKQEYELMLLEQQAAETAREVKGSMYDIADSFNLVNDVKVDPTVVKDLENFVNTLDLSDLDPEQYTKFAKEFANVQKLMTDALNKNDSAAFEEAMKLLEGLSKQAKNGEKAFKGLDVTFEDFIENLKNGKSIFVDAGDDIAGMGDAAEEVETKVYTLKDTLDILSGVTQDQIDDTNDLIYRYEMLVMQLADVSEAEQKAILEKENLSAEEEVLKKQIEEKNKALKALDAMYPSLLNSEGKMAKSAEERIALMKEENRAQEILRKAFKLSEEGKLSAEQNMTLNTAAGTQKRIKEIEKEITALLLLQEQMYNTAMTNQEFLKGIQDGTVKDTGHSMAVPQIVQEQEITKKSVELDKLRELLNSSTSAIDGFTSAIENSEKSSKKGNKETEKSVYLTDKYKQAMDELNLAIQRQKALMDEQYKGSNKRRAALQEQIKLEKQKLEVMLGQEKSLKSQIASGKVQQTGTVKQSQTIAGGQKIGGAFEAAISSTFGSRKDNHRGVDFAASKGTAINSPVSGKVIAAGDAKSQGQHWSYGNLVIVQDSSGVKHIMAHMEKVMTKVGDQIVAGTQVGTVGSTGNSTGNHLHYEQNKDGKVLNPNATVDAIRKGTITTQSGTVGISTGQESVDNAKSTLNQTQQDIIAQQKLLRELDAMMVDEMLANYENRKEVYNRTIQNVENNMKKLNVASEAYRFELDKQGKALLDKRKVNQEELTYLQNVIAKGKLSDAALFDLQARLQELKNENAQIDFAINDNYLAKIESLNALIDETISKYDKLRDAQDKTIEYMNVSMGDLDKTSQEYVKALNDINKAQREKQAANRKELNDLNQLIRTGKVYGDALEKTKDRVLELQTQIKQLQLDIQEGNFEILVTIKNESDEVVDNIQFEISRLEEIRKMYEQGSGDYLKYTDDLVKQQKKLADQHEKTRDALLAELKQQDISKERIKEIKELLEDEHMAYLQATNAIRDYTKQKDEANKSRLEDIANSVINALKSAYQELRDEHMRTLDEMIKKETEAHEKRLKDLKDEQDLFRKNVEERLRLIDRQEAQRGYDMDIADLEKERSKIQERMFEISNDNSYSAKKERKALQEQLDKIDKDIAERRHERDIELQKQGLNDLLEMKDQEIEGKIEAENEGFDNTIKQINREKQYWEKHYQDLLNDERKFAQIREDIMNGHFDKVEAEMREHIQNLTATMPQLADTMDGTMKAVGMALRQNVIDGLQQAIDKMHEFNELASTIKNDFTDNFNPNSPDSGGNSSGGIETSQGNLSNADMKVLMGKFLYDNVAPALSGSAQTSARNKGRELGQSGYKQGATIDEGLNFGSAMSGLTPAEQEAFKKYLNSQLGSNGGAYDKYIKEFLGGNSDISNTTNRYGVKTPMSYGDMQVMMAKYMRELLINPSTPQALKTEIQTQANAMAAQGRASGSQVSSDVTYGAVLNSLDKAQRAQFKSFLSNQSLMIKNQDLKNKAKNYAASLDTGGMLNFSGGGIDGKGGKLIIGHPNEVVNNPIETSELLATVDSSRVMLQHLSGLARNLQGVAPNTIGGGQVQSGDTFEINFHGDFVNMSKTMADRMAGFMMDSVRTKKGIFSNSR